MFYNDKSDYGPIIAGLFFMSIIALTYGAIGLMMGLEKADLIGDIDPVMDYVVLIIGLIIAGFAMYKGYIVEGMTFGVVGLSVMFLLVYSPVAGVIFAIAFLVLAYISYYVGYIDLVIFDVLMAAASVLLMCIDGDNIYFTIGGIVMIIAGVISLYVCICDWKDVQDTLYEMEMAMLDMDDCCDDECCCGDEECGDDCECHCHDKDKEKVN